LIKVRANHENRRNIIEISNLFRTRIIDTSPDSLIIELTGETGKIDAFITMLGDFEILEIARTGITGLGRGVANVTYLD
jgi:acetolactate synthase-1/3 small subunit